MNVISFLKRVYEHQFEKLMRNNIKYITKSRFLSAFQAIYFKTITDNNAREDFRSNDLISFNSETILFTLNISIHTFLSLRTEIL